ncbi:MAG: DUF2764 domain-containing protein [Treponema sp.]|nr:DUF2764 domain-containing protein [Treponema sp.]
MAQLPYLVYDQKPPMSSGEFKTLAQLHMSKNDADLLNIIMLDSSGKKNSGCKFIDNWNNWERELRLNLAKQRIIKLKKENIKIPEPSDYHTDVTAIAVKAADEHSPLEGEIIIDKARWSAIDNLVGNDYFSRNNVYAYYLKLLILERREAFNAERGFAEYKSMYAFIVESAQSSRGEHA